MENSIRDQLFQCGTMSVCHVPPQTFIPKSSIEEIMTRENIARTVTMDSRFPFQDTSTVIAILIYTKEFNKSTLKNLESNELTDSCLPLTLDKEANALISKNTGLTISISPGFLSYSGCKSFCENQWRFLAPVLGGVKHLEYDKNTILPIIEKKEGGKGSFGKVSKVRIHPSHLNLGVSQPQQSAQSKNTYLALKELLADEADVKKFDRERQALEAIQKLQHPHLIKYYGSFQIGDESEHKFYFLFAWASGGSLKTFWKNPTTAGGRKAPQMMRWMLDQAEGLAKALGALHGPKDPPKTSPGDSIKKNGRHGDLRPENIVVSQRPGDSTSWGTLQITDAGLARFHEMITINRPDGTSTQGGSVEYAPPEGNDVGDRRGRRYDMWSLGCILLEFMVWILDGMEEVNALREARKTTPGLGLQHRNYPPFYVDSKLVSSSWFKKSEEYVIHPVIERRMKELKKDERCRGTFLPDLLQEIQNGLLCIKEHDRFYSEVLVEKIGAIVEKGKVQGHSYFSLTLSTSGTGPPGSPQPQQAARQKKRDFNLFDRASRRRGT